MLPDGSVADVSVDFATLNELNGIAQKYGYGGAVQHGASTLPESAFNKFVEAEAVEVHLATNFQNMAFERFPETLRRKMYAYLDAEHTDERKPEQSDEQFYYKSRKRAIGKFKKETWSMDAAEKAKICDAWEAQFAQLFDSLAIADTRKYVDQFVAAPMIKPDMTHYQMSQASEEDVSDLAD